VSLAEIEDQMHEAFEFLLASWIHGHAGEVDRLSGAIEDANHAWLENLMQEH
jgi:hypothetical protein